MMYAHVYMSNIILCTLLRLTSFVITLACLLCASQWLIAIKFNKMAFTVSRVPCMQVHCKSLPLHAYWFSSH